MAKKQTKPKTQKPADIPSVEIPPGVEIVLNQNETIETPSITQEAKNQPDSMPVETVTLVIPKSKLTFGYEPRRCDVTALTGDQRSTLRKITNGLIAQGELLKNGKIVNNPQDALKWILENATISG